jgi:hypothetical protein
MLAELMNRGWLRPASGAEVLASKHPSAELRALLRRQGLHREARANHRQLADLVITHLPDSLPRDWQAKGCVVTADDGMAWIKRFQADSKSARSVAIQRTLEQLMEGNLAHALREQATFVRHYESPDFDSEPDLQLLERVLQPGRLCMRWLSPEAVDRLRPHAALRELWLTEPSYPLPPAGLLPAGIDLATVTDLIIRDAGNWLTLSEDHESRTLKIEFRPLANACPQCQAKDGRTFPSHATPSFPLPDCSHPVGCIPFLSRHLEEEPKEAAPGTPTIEEATHSQEMETPSPAECTFSPQDGRAFLRRCREQIQNALDTSHPDFLRLSPKDRVQAVNALIRRDFGWATQACCEILLRQDEPPPVDFSRFVHLGLPESLLQHYLYCRAGIYLTQAFWIPENSPWDGKSTARHFAELVQLAKAGLFLRGRQIPVRHLLEHFTVANLRAALHELTGRKGADRTKPELISILIQFPDSLAAKSFGNALVPKCEQLPLDEFFFANPAPEGFTAEETEFMGGAYRYWSCFNLALQATTHQDGEAEMEGSILAFAASCVEEAATCGSGVRINPGSVSGGLVSPKPVPPRV